MTDPEIERLRALVESGASDAEIRALVLDARDADLMAECDTADAERFERDAYGEDDHSRDDWTHSQIATQDRMDRGRNEAGEWIGFM